MKIVIDHQPNQADNAVLSDGVFEAHADLVGKRDESLKMKFKEVYEDRLSALNSVF